MREGRDHGSDRAVLGDRVLAVDADDRRVVHVVDVDGDRPARRRRPVIGHQRDGSGRAGLVVERRGRQLDRIADDLELAGVGAFEREGQRVAVRVGGDEGRDLGVDGAVFIDGVDRRHAEQRRVVRVENIDDEILLNVGAVGEGSADAERVGVRGLKVERAAARENDAFAGDLEIAVAVAGDDAPGRGLGAVIVVERQGRGPGERRL